MMGSLRQPKAVEIITSDLQTTKMLVKGGLRHNIVNFSLLTFQEERTYDKINAHFKPSEKSIG